MANKAIYPGSFDPFTNGHLDIVRKAAGLFEKVYVVLGLNNNKHRTFGAEEMKTAITQALEDAKLRHCEVCICDGLVAEFARQKGADYMIRGLRNNMDYNYEENIAEVNKLIKPSLEYVYFRADNIAVSSSMVKELLSYQKDVSRFVPPAVFQLIK